MFVLDHELAQHCYFVSSQSVAVHFSVRLVVKPVAFDSKWSKTSGKGLHFRHGFMTAISRDATGRRMVMTW